MSIYTENGYTRTAATILSVLQMTMGLNAVTNLGIVVKTVDVNYIHRLKEELDAVERFGKP